MAANWTAFVSGQVLTAAQLNGVVDNFADMAIFNETQATNTQGGTSVGATFTKRTLNTTVINNIGATLSSSVIALLAGTYYVQATSPFLGCNSVKIRLQNTSDASTTLTGPSNYFASGGIVGGEATIQGTFTIAATKNFELQYYVETSRASNGLGVAVNATGSSEIYTSIQILRIA